MGQSPAKFFPFPAAFGQSPDSNVVNQAQAPPQAPLNNFLPLNQGSPAGQTTPQPPSPMGKTPNDQFGGANSNLRRMQPMFWNRQ